MQRTSSKPDDPQILAIIRDAADRHQVPRQVALAFAWCESKLNPLAQGDLGWHLRKMGMLYRTKVLERPELARNPARSDGPSWHSYGLFQLLACYHVLPHEHPRELLDPRINADRGCAQIARLLKRAHGEARGARLLYVGCGENGELCSEHVVHDVTEKLHRALQRFESERGK